LRRQPVCGHAERPDYDLVTHKTATRSGVTAGSTNSPGPRFTSVARTGWHPDRRRWPSSRLQLALEFVGETPRPAPHRSGIRSRQRRNAPLSPPICGAITHFLIAGRSPASLSFAA
jgi:hypothetical protein